MRGVNSLPPDDDEGEHYWILSKLSAGHDGVAGPVLTTSQPNPAQGGGNLRNMPSRIIIKPAIGRSVRPRILR